MAQSQTQDIWQQINQWWQGFVEWVRQNPEYAAAIIVAAVGALIIVALRS